VPGAHSDSSKSRRVRGRRFVLLLLVALLVVGGFVVRPHLGEWARPILERRLGEALGGKVTLGSLDLDLWRLEATFSRLSVVVPAPGAEPLRIDVPSGAVRFRWSRLPALPGRRLHLAELRLVGPVVEVERAFWDAQRDRSRTREPLDLRFGILEVVNGRLRYDDFETPAQFRATSVELKGGWDGEERAVRVRASLRLAVERAPLATELNIDFRGEALLRRHEIELRGIEAVTDGALVDFEGRLAILDRVSLVGRGVARLDLDRLDAALDEDFPEVGGSLSGPFTVETGPHPLRIRGEFTGRALRFGRFAATEATAGVRITPDGVVLHDLVARAFDGEVEGSAEVGFGKPAGFTAAVTGRDLASPLLLDWLGVPVPLDARLDGGLGIEGLAGDLGSWDGTGEFVARRRELPGDGLPAAGRGDFRIAEGKLQVTSADAEIAAARFDVVVAVDLEGEPKIGEIVLEGETADAGETQRGSLRILEELGIDVPDLLREPLAGRGPVRAAIGWGGEGRFDLALDLADGAWGRQRFDSASAEVAVRESTARIRGLHVTRGGESLSADAAIDLEKLAVLQLDLAGRDVDVAWVLDLIGVEADISGRMDATISVPPGSGGESGHGVVTLRDVAIWGEVLDSAEARVEIRPDAIAFPAIRVEGPAVTAEGSASWRRGAERLELSLIEVRVALGGLERLRSAEIPLEGDVTLSGELSIEGPELDGDLNVAGDRWSILETPVGSSRGRLRLTQEGADFELSDEADGRWSAEGSIGWQDGLPAQVDLRLDGTRFELGLDGGAWGTVTARLNAQGPLLRPEAIRVGGEVEELGLQVGFEVLRLLSPFSVGIRRGALEAGPIRLRGGGSDLTARVLYDTEAGRLDASVVGEVDLGLLAAPFPEVRASGVVVVEMAARGSLEHPLLEGRLETTDGKVRLLDLHQNLDHVEFRASVEGERVRIEEFRARSGNGLLSGAGEAKLAGDSLATYSGEFQAANMKLSYPEGFRGVYEARLRLEGGPEEATLSGRIELLQGVYDRDLGLTELIGHDSREIEAPKSTDLPGKVFLDLDLVSDGTVRVRNDLARIEAGLDLRVEGTLRRPEVTGRIGVVPGGQLTFRGVRYRIVSSNVDFTERDRIDPYLTLHAETNVAEYTISLRIEGTAQRFHYELTSEPSLTTPDIITLLTTGSALGRTGNEDFGSESAANYFGGMLTMPVTSQLERIVGVDRIEVNPVLVEGGGDPTTRLTIGEEIADDVVVVFSTDFGQSEHQLYKVNWFVTRKIRLAAESDSQRGNGGEIGYYTRFGGKRPRARSEPPGTDAPPGPGPVTEGLVVTDVRIEGVSPTLADELLSRVGVVVGDPFSRSAMYKGVESIRRYFVDLGHVESQVRAADEISDSGVALRYEVSPGAAVDVLFDGVGKKEARKLTLRLRELWVESVFGEDLYADSADLIRDYFQDEGYYAADVVYASEVREKRRQVRFTIDRGQPVRVEEVVVDGGDSIPEERVRNQILTRSGGTFSKRPLEPSTLEEDRRAVRALYREEGFVTAEVEPPRVRLSSDGSVARIEFRIVEGPRFLIGDVAVSSTREFADDELLDWAGLDPGGVYSSSRLLRGENRLRDEFDGRGYPDARIRGRTEIEGQRVDIRYDVDPGGLKRVGRIRIVGNDLTKDKVILRELELEPGDLIAREKVLGSQRALYRLGLFRNVRLSYGPLDPDDPVDQLLDVAVEENAPYVTSLGTGYNTEAGIHVNWSVANENLGGHDRILGFQTRYSDIEKRLSVSAKEPRFLDRKLTLLSTITWEDREEPGFSFERTYWSTRVDKRLGVKWSEYLRYSFQNVIVNSVEDPEELTREKIEDVRLGDLGYAVVRDIRDNPFAAAKGTFMTLGASLFAKPLGSERSFVQQEANVSRIWPLRGGTAFGSAIRVATAWKFGTGTRATVPISESFFLGGDSTLRGFARDELGPGEGLLLFNEEFRFPIWRILKGEVFFDAGNVYENPEDLDILDMRVVLGAGLRLETPIGPLRLEYGHKLDREEGESPGELFFAIGSAF
jgi:outer membrane protein insertion porin family